MSSYPTKSYEMRNNVNNYQDDSDVMNQIANQLREIGNNIIQIRNFTNQIGTSKDSEELRKKMNYVATQTNHLVKGVTQDFRMLDSVERSNDKNKKMQKAKLVKEFESVVASLKQVTTIAAQKEKSTPVPQSTFTRKEDDYYAEPDFDSQQKENEKLLKDQRFQAVEQERIYQDDMVRRRNDEIKQIEKAVTEVNEMFLDVSQLVSEQGLMIDNIESNVEKGSQETKQAVQELKKASQYQRSSRSKMCCLLLLILIIAGAAAFGFWLFLGGPFSSSPAPAPAPNPAPATTTAAPVKQSLRFIPGINQFLEQIQNNQMEGNRFQ